MGKHLGDRPEFLLGLGVIAERPRAKQAEASEPDHDSRKLGFVFHRGTVARWSAAGDDGEDVVGVALDLGLADP